MTVSDSSLATCQFFVAAVTPVGLTLAPSSRKSDDRVLFCTQKGSTACAVSRHRTPSRDMMISLAGGVDEFDSIGRSWSGGLRSVGLPGRSLQPAGTAHAAARS